MAIPQIAPYDYFYQWREKTNLIATLVGDITSINVAAEDRDSLIEAINKIISNVGGLVSLTTTNKTSTVAAINELDGEIGVLSSLTTNVKSSLVDAINETFSLVGGGGGGTLTTTAQTVTGAINELDAEHGVLSGLTTSYKTTFVGAINELVTKIGSLATLNTTAKDNLVEAVSEVQTELGTISSLTTTVKTSAVAAINELDGEIGVLSTLSTTAKSTTVAAINEVFSMHLITNCTFTVGTEAANVIRVTAQIKDSAGSNIAFRSQVFAYLSDDSDGSTLISTAHSGGWAIGTAGLLIPMVANKAANFITNATGSFNVDITETAGKTAYLVVALPNGKIVVSAAITHAA